MAARNLETPDRRAHKTVLGNDHALVVIGFNADVVVIRDVLGPTSSNWERPYEYRVDWSTCLLKGVGGPIIRWIGG